MRIIIAGSFLYNKNYNDIDVFFISKYEKEDYRKENMHFNYLGLDAEGSLFLSSLSKICVSNFDLDFPIKEEIDLNTIIAKYQEVLQDIGDNNKRWAKIDLRDFLIDCTYAAEGIILSSLQLKKRLEKTLKTKNKIKILEKIFIYAVLNGFEHTLVKSKSRSMLESYQELIQEYKNKKYLIKL